MLRSLFFIHFLISSPRNGGIFAPPGRVRFRMQFLCGFERPSSSRSNVLLSVCTSHTAFFIEFCFSRLDSYSSIFRDFFCCTGFEDRMCTSGRSVFWRQSMKLSVIGAVVFHDLAFYYIRPLQEGFPAKAL